MVKRSIRLCKVCVIFGIAIFGVVAASYLYEFIAGVFEHNVDSLGKAVAIFYGFAVYGILKGCEKIYCACAGDDDDYYED